MATLYVSDLDGTLLRDDASMPEPSKVALQQLIADGLAFSVASARSVVSMQVLLRGLTLKLPVVEFNGAFVSDLQTGHHEIVNAIDPMVAQDVFALMQQFSCSPFVSTFNGTADRLYYGETTNGGERYYVSNRREYNDHRLRHTRDLVASLRDQVVCLTVIGKPEALRELELAIEELFGDFVEIHLLENAYSPGWYWLTIHDRRATKDQAIQLLMDTYGLGNHELVVFGDNINDVKMFRIAAQAVAVANAHPEAKRHATHVIGPNEEDSVLKYIRSHYAKQAKQ